MSKMKKFVALFLAVALVAQGGFTSSATEVSDTPAVVGTEMTETDTEETAEEETTKTDTEETAEAVQTTNSVSENEETLEESSAKEEKTEETNVGTPASEEETTEESAVSEDAQNTDTPASEVPAEETAAESAELNESAAEDTVSDAVQAFLTAVGEIVVPDEITEETGPALNEQIGAAQAAYDALSEEELAREDVQEAAAVLQQAIAALTGGVQTLEGDEEAVAKIGDETYLTLDGAVAAAADGDTIIVLADCTTEGLNLSKNLTIQAEESLEEAPSITFTKYGIALWGKSLTFKNVNVSMDNIGSTPYTGEWNWMTICASKNASLTLDNVTMTMDGANAGNKHAIYFCSNNKLNLINGSVLTIKNYQQDALEWDGGDGGYNVNITDSTFISEHNRSGFTGTFYATIKNSDVQVLNSTGNGSNGSHFIIEDSTVDFSGNGSHGLSAGILSVTNSTITAENNGMTGIIFNSKGTFVNSKITITGTKGISYWNAGMRLYTANSSATVDKDTVLTISDNEVTGIFMDVSTSLTIEDGAEVLVTRNHAEQKNCSSSQNLAKSGGGLVVRNGATAVLSSTTEIYNNHAALRGDDIYLEGTASTLTFNAVGSDWYLDGDPDCTDAIDGWYCDGQVGDFRWEAHDKPYYTIEHAFKSTDTDKSTDTVTGMLALKAAHGLPKGEVEIPSEIPDSEWTVSRSKTATELNENYESQVTLSLPSYEETLVTDVVFVLDESSCTEPVKAEVANILETLYAQIEKTDATIKIGAVQFRGEVTRFELTELTSDTKTAVTEFMSSRPETGGSNMSAGLIAGEKMLDEDTSVSADRKYLILVSDGITYIWDDETTEQQENLGVNFANGDTPDQPMLASPDGWDVKYGNKYVPEDWREHLTAAGKLLNKTIGDKSSVYDRNDSTAGKDFIHYTEKADYVSTVDIALYKSYEVYQSIASKYSHTYAVAKGVESEIATFPFGMSFMSYLAGGEDVSFDSILKEIIYLVDEGSYVEDYIGYKADDYNFDFVNDASALCMTVGGESGSAVLLGQTDEETVYGFVPQDDAEHPYAYTLSYYPGTLADDEYFRWDIYVPVTNFEQVQLVYKVQLKNPKTAAGTYGQYDEDGSLGYEELYTNNSAVLYPVDSTGAMGDPQEFAKPTVSYTVKEETTDTPGGNKTEDPGTSSSSGGKKHHHSSSDDTSAVSEAHNVTTAKTEDTNNILLPVLMLLLAAGLLGGYGFTVYRKKKRS